MNTAVTSTAARAASLVCLAIGVAGCDKDPARPDLPFFSPTRGEAPIQTDQTVYAARPVEGTHAPYDRYGFTIRAQFRNTTVKTVWLARCFPDSDTPIFGIRAEDEAESGYEQLWACVGHDEQFPVRPGESRVDVIEVRGPNAWDGHTHESFGALEGRFRLYYQVRSSAGEYGEQLPIERAISNEFVVTLD